MTAHYGCTMVSKTIAVCPLVVPAAAVLVGIDNDRVHFRLADGTERAFEVPFSDGGLVKVYCFGLPEAKEAVFLMLPDDEGNHKIEVTAEQSHGIWFAVAKATKLSDLKAEAEMDSG